MQSNILKHISAFNQTDGWITSNIYQQLFVDLTITQHKTAAESDDGWSGVSNVPAQRLYTSCACRQSHVTSCLIRHIFARHVSKVKGDREISTNTSIPPISNWSKEWNIFYSDYYYLLDQFMSIQFNSIQMRFIKKWNLHRT